MKKYLVTGAAGFLGRAVVAELLSQDAEVVALVLPDDPLAADLPKGVTVVGGNVCDKASLAPFFQYADSDTCVIHCAGIVSIASQPDKQLYSVNVDGTANVILMCHAAKIAKLVYVSSVHAIPEAPPGVTITEPESVTPALVRGHYAKSKAMATGLVKAAVKYGLNASCVFPSGIIGPGDMQEGSFTHMLRSFLAGRLPLAVRGGYDFVDVRDVAEGIVSCAKLGKAGGSYILSGHYATIREVLELVKQEGAVKWAVRCLPICIAKLIAPVYERSSLRKKKPLYFTPYSVDVLASNGRFSHRAATAALGYEPRPLRETLRDTVLWLRSAEVPAEGRKLPEKA